MQELEGEFIIHRERVQMDIAQLVRLPNGDEVIKEREREREREREPLLGPSCWLSIGKWLLD